MPAPSLSLVDWISPGKSQSVVSERDVLSPECSFSPLPLPEDLPSDSAVLFVAAQDSVVPSVSAQESVELALREVWANLHSSEIVGSVNTARRFNRDVQNAVEAARENLAAQEIEVTLTKEIGRLALFRLLTARSTLDKLANLRLADLIDDWLGQASTK